MKRIFEELSRVEALFEELWQRDDFEGNYSQDPHRAPEHTESREWQVLGRAVQLLREAGKEAPEFAEKQSPQHQGDDPDFQTFLSPGVSWLPVEVAEVVRPDYAREREMRRQFPLRPMSYDGSNVLADPWRYLEEVILKKSRKVYAGRTCLLVYYGIGVFSFQKWDVPVIEKLMVQHAAKPFPGVTSFSRVLVITSDMSSLAELHPIAAVIACGKQ
jgi:hypothetical protein